MLPATPTNACTTGDRTADVLDRPIVSAGRGEAGAVCRREAATRVTSAELLADAFGRIGETVHGVVDGLSPDQLAFRVGGTSNSISWLVWHLTRIQDDHLADVAGTDQAWTSLDWAVRFGLPLAVTDTGYGHTSHQVAAVTSDGAMLAGYHDEVLGRTLRFLQGVTDADLNSVVDERWDPPVTLGVRLVSVVDDSLQHAGQAAYVRGILERR
jgi:hypothetical protein